MIQPGISLGQWQSVQGDVCENAWTGTANALGIREFSG